MDRSNTICGGSDNGGTHAPAADNGTAEPADGAGMPALAQADAADKRAANVGVGNAGGHPPRTAADSKSAERPLPQTTK